MRTKTLILTAALSAAGVASAMAQGAVYSVNAVGYVNKVLKPGFNLISNPLVATDNTIANLFKDTPDGTQVYKYDGTRFTSATKDVTFEPPAAAALTVMPGEGVFVRNPLTTDVTVTFVGDVKQGQLDTDLRAGLQIVSSQVPQANTAEALGLPAQDGDQLYQYDAATQKYKTSTYDAGWLPALGTLSVGEAFFLKRGAPGKWSRNFSVNTQ